MEKVNELLKLDKQGIFYIDSKDTKIEPFNFYTDIRTPYTEKRVFYHIPGIDNYIVKDIEYHKLFFFNEIRYRKLIKLLMDKQDQIPEVDFPIGYYGHEGNCKGIIIPYYRNALSLRFITNLCCFDDLMKYYHHDDNKMCNLVNLCLDILYIIKKMYDENVFYIDVNSGNFLIYNNNIKVIDFEPGFVYINNKKDKYQDYILRNYANLVDLIWRKFGFADIIFNRGENFSETEDIVKSLVKLK